MFLPGPIKILALTSLTVVTPVTPIIDTMAVYIRGDSFHTCLEGVRITLHVFCNCDQLVLIPFERYNGPPRGWLLAGYLEYPARVELIRASGGGFV